MGTAKRVVFGAIVAAGALAFATTASAAVTPTYTGSVALTTTNWTRSIVIPKFDPNLGTLTGVTCELVGTATGTAKVENTSTEEANTITVQTSATLTLTKPDNSGPLVQVLPLINETNTYPAFDGTFDYAGASGAVLTPMTNTQTASSTATDGPTLALFVASSIGETVSLPMRAMATSWTSDTAGNFERSTTTKASASVSCHYTYTAAPPVDVPEFPIAVLASGSAAIIGGSVLGLRRRRAA